MSVFSMAGSNPALPTYPLQRSVRLRSSATAYFNRTPASATNQRTWTWSNWVKRGALGTEQQIFEGGVFSGSTEQLRIFFTSTDNIEFSEFSSAAYQFRYVTTQVFRDPSAWYHIVAVLDTTDATSTNRVKLYINGVQVTSFSTSTTPTLNFQGKVNSVIAHDIGRRNGTGTPYLDGYLTEVNFIDGQALTPSSFGAYNSYGVWSPAKYTGTYGTNGFYLNFQDNSALTTTANVGIGKDSSGNGNYWTSNNISITAGVTYDSMLDVPTLTSNTNANFSTLNPLDTVGGTFSNANLTVSVAAGGGNLAFNTMGVTSGKWYWEITPTTLAAPMIGVADANTAISTRTFNGANGWYYYNNGLKYNSGTGTAYGASYVANDVVGIALDMDAGTLTFYKNNVSQGVAYSGFTGKTMIAALNNGGSGAAQPYNANFGQQPFTYTPPTGYNRLCTYNLPDSIVPVGAQYFAATKYTGNHATNAITNTVNGFSMQPDFIWIKDRSAVTAHVLFDSVRGVGGYLSTNNTTVEDTTQNYAKLNSFNSNGFTLGASTLANDISNYSGDSFVGWQWRASNASAVSNTSGSITSQVSANQTAGFSIVTRTGTGANGTIGHGLGVAPKMIINKSRSNGAFNWAVYHASLTNANYVLYLDATNAQQSEPTTWNATAPTSSVFSVGTSSQTNLNAATYVSYCFAAVPGYSAFGSYTGNGSTDGPFVYCGFRPRWVLIKRVDTAGDSWFIFDSSRETYNVEALWLAPNLSNVETTNTFADFLSNGFKLRGSISAFNGSGSTYIYAAFAENPFKNALAR